MESLAYRIIHSQKSTSFYRGISPTTGTHASAFGKGFYFTSNKNTAKIFAGPEGKIISVDPSYLPKNPLAFSSVGEFDNWISKNYMEQGFTNVRDFNKKYPDIGVFIKSFGYDGVKIGNGKDADYVKYNV